VAGTQVIIAESYARIFYRNCVDGGFVVPYETPEKLNNRIRTGDELEINLEDNSVKNITKNEVYYLNPLDSILPIIEAGNIFEYARQNNMM
jgi:3-isopropylmalate/(R)-2-methylmalate dehydratase small subunit